MTNDPLGLFDEEGSDPLGLFSDQEPTALDKIKAVGETGLSLGSSMLGAVPAAVGAGLSVANDLGSGKELNFKNKFEDLSRFFTYEPRTELGKEYTDDAAKSGFMQSLNALGAVAHTMPPVRTAPSIKSLVPKDIPVPKSIKDVPVAKPKDPLGLFEGQGELDLFSPDQKQLGRSPYDAVGGKWQVDENGIPVKQALSEEVSRTADEGVQPRLFEDPTPPKDPVIAKAEDLARMDEEMAVRKKLEEDVSRLQQKFQSQPVSRGPRGQRGAIDVEAVKEMSDLFKKGVATARDVVASFKGAFTEIEHGMAMKSLDNPKSLDTVALMSPKQFHELASGRTPAELNADYTPRLHESIREGLKSKSGLWEMPYLRVDKDGQVVAHEGRHRMDVFQEQGLDLVPVRLRKEAGEGWGTWNIPSKIIPQDFRDSPPVIRELAKRHFPEVLTKKASVTLPKSQRGAIILAEKGGKNIELAKKLLKQKMSPATVFDLTGVYKEAGKFKTAISDANSEIIPGALKALDTKTLTLDKVLKHNALFDLYPELKNIKVMRTNKGSRLYIYGKLMIIHIDNVAPFKKTLMHEVQHVIQELEGFKKGGSAEEISNRLGIPYDEGYKQYHNLPGEQEARFTESNVDKTQASLEADIKDLLKAESTPGMPAQLHTIPNSQRGGLDIKDIGDGVKKLVSAVTRKDIPKAGEKAPSGGKEQAVGNLPGNKEIMDNYIPADPTASDILEAALGVGDSNMKFSGLQSGATLTGMKYDSPLIQGIGRLYQNAQKRSEKLIRDLVYPVEHTFKALPKKEVIELSDLMKTEMFDGKEVTLEQMREAGYTNKQVQAYQELRTMFNEAYAKQVEALQAQNKKVPTKREAYLSSRWNGDWHVPVYNKAGKLVYYIAEKTKSQAFNALEYMKEQGLDVDTSKTKIEYKGGWSKKGNVHDAYLTMLSVIDSADPRAKQLKSVMEEAMANDAYNVLGQKKHFESKANVRGFLGDRPWKDAKTNAYDLFKEQFNYAKNAFTWTEMQKATDTSKEVLSNEYLVQEQPNNVHYAQEYAKNKLGFGEANFVTDMEHAANKILGTSRASWYNAIGDMKSYFIITKLGFNLGFMGANIIQPVFTLPWHANLVSHGIPHNPLKTFSLGGYDAIAGYGKYALGLDMPMTKLGKDALRYAEDNGIVNRTMFDETANLGRHPVIETAEKIGSTSIQAVEHQARLNSFMGFVHHLDQSGQFKDMSKLFQKAEELTNAAMVDYRPGEGPMMFDKMGLTGDALRTLQTFKFNYYNQLHYFFKEAKEGRPSALLTFLGLQGMLGGALGMPLMQEIDDIWETIRDHLPNDLHHRVKDFGIKKKLMETLPDWAAYGGVSKLTGANLSSRFDSGNLADFSLDSLFPFFKDIGKQVTDVAKMANNPNATTAAQAAYSVTPPGPLQGTLETNMDAFKGGTSKEGNTTYLNPRDLQKQDASFVRTPVQEQYRRFGLTELSESKYKDLRYKQGKSDQESTLRRNEQTEKFFDAVVRQDKKDMEKAIYYYTRYDGNPQTLIDRIEEDGMRRRLPRETIEATKANTLTAIQKAKRMKELLGGFNH